MTSITNISIALPEYNYSAEELIQAASIWLADDRLNFEIFKRFVESSKIQNRRFAQSLPEILNQAGLQSRAEKFEAIGTPLAQAAISNLTKQNVDLNSIDTLIFCSCSCPVIPSIDGLVVEKLKLSPNINRIPMFQYGCAGGVAGLALAYRLAKSGSKVVLCATEICSLVFQSNNHAPAQLVAGAIFGDGAAAMIIDNAKGPLEIIAASSHLLPDSRYLMGYDLKDDGLHLRLDRDLPQALMTSVPQIVAKFLAQNALSQEQIKFWLFHPGGQKILKSLEECFKLDPQQSIWSSQVLSEVGNLSSASVFLVVDKFIKSNQAKENDPILMLGIGPGLTVELVLMRYTKS